MNRKLEEGLVAMRWIQSHLVPQEWTVSGSDIPRAAYDKDEARAIHRHVTTQNPEFTQPIAFILISGARIDEAFHLRAGKVFPDEGRVELLGKGGRSRRIQVLRREGLRQLDLDQRYVFYRPETRRPWKPSLEAAVREACDTLEIRRRGVHGLRGTAANEFLHIKRDILGLSERGARRELAQWLGHHPQRTEMTYAYVPRRP